MSKFFYAGGFLYNPKSKSVLLHKRDGNTSVNPNRWAFFGGGSEPGENPAQTFVREIEEELSVRLDVKEVMPLRDDFNQERDTHRHVFYAKSELEKSEMILGEGADFEWVPLSRVFEFDLTDKVADDLRFFLERFS